MKPRHISILTIVAIVIVTMTSLGVFIEKLNNNPEHPYVGMEIVGVKENYTINKPIDFSVLVKGYGSGCGDTNATITRQDDPQYNSSGWYSVADCTSNVKLSYFKFTSLSVHTSINQTGNYSLVTSFGDSVTSRHTVIEQKFSVIMPRIR